MKCLCKSLVQLFLLNIVTGVSLQAANLEKDRVVLISTGALAPIHNGHIEMMEVAKRELESNGSQVVKAIFSPSSDFYVQRKGNEFLKYPFSLRFKLCRSAIADKAWMSCDDWEGRQNRFVDFPEVVQQFKSYYEPKGIRVVYLFGSDNLSFASVLERKKIYGLCLTRDMNLVPKNRHKSKYISIVHTKHNFSSVSSSLIRRALQERQKRGGATLRESIVSMIPELIREDLTSLYEETEALTLQEKLKIYSKWNWFENVLGKAESRFKKSDFVKDSSGYWTLHHGDESFFVGKFFHPTFLEIKENYDKKSTQSNHDSKMTFKVEYGRDALELTMSQDAANSIIQVASQFNALESPGRYLSNVTNYLYDRTQGPRAVMPTAAASLFRTLFQNDYNALYHTPLKKFVNHGYLSWGSSSVASDLRIEMRPDLYDKMEVPYMISSPELSEHKVTHFFCASAPTGAYGNSSGEDEDLIVYNLLRRQYLGLGMYAAQKARENKSRQKVHLTMVGMGVFNNNKEIFIKVMDEFLGRFQNDPIDVTLHSFSASSVAESVVSIFNQHEKSNKNL